MSQIQSLLESAGQGYKNLQSDAAKLAAKWEKTGLLEGLKSETEKNNMSLILENQAKQLVTEISQVDGGTATFTPGTGNNWAGIALPSTLKVNQFMVTKLLQLTHSLQLTQLKVVVYTVPVVLVTHYQLNQLLILLSFSQLPQLLGRM